MTVSRFTHSQRAAWLRTAGVAVQVERTPEQLRQIIANADRELLSPKWCEAVKAEMRIARDKAIAELEGE